MWNILNIVCFLTIYVTGKTAVGRYYRRLKSREGQADRCPTPRLVPILFKKYCKSLTPCENDKGCRKPKWICECHEHCGRVCIDPTSTCYDGYCKNGGTCSVLHGNASCSCPSNFSGNLCENDVDECQVNNKCKNGGTCANNFGGYICSCIFGWDGPECTINKDDCVPSGNTPLCYNGGTCIDKVGKYDCLCPPGKMGPVCQHDDQCYHKPCYGTASCFTDAFGAYSCICPRGWTGKNCSIDIDECSLDLVSPCHHGGTCVNTDGSFECSCVAGYKGERCDKFIDECASNPCKNGANCLDYTNYFVCACIPGWTGKYCETLINECASSPCQNGGQCTDLLNKYSCKCTIGFNGTNCETNIDDCAHPNPCKNGATCTDGVGSYTCTCASGFTGGNCDKDIDDCVSVPCKHYGTCVDEVNGYSCQCTPGYTGNNCENQVDECASNPCMNGGSCTDLQNGFRCTCPQGTSGVRCEHNVDDCIGVTCANGGTCIDELNSYKCACHPGFYGGKCEMNTDECRSQPCQNGGICTDGVAQYHCQCPADFTGRSCETRVDNCLGNQCQNGATCLSEQNGYSCQCAPGFKRQLCEVDIDECASNPCNHGECRDGLNKYVCVCDSGYSGTKCDTNIDDCQPNPCFHGSTCFDKVNNFSCMCSPGFSGQRCEHHIDECNSQPCQNGATCVDEIGSYSCYCKPGYTGRNCESVINWCQSSPCKNGGTCKQDPNALDFHCDCLTGFKGIICDVENITCNNAKTKLTDRSTVCLNGGTCIDDYQNVQSCSCPPGFMGSFCESNINDCASGPCKNGAQCSDGVANYTCSCARGFAGDDCETNIDDCALNPCDNGGTCIDLVDGFICSCPVGYVGNRCEQNPNDCLISSTACFNGGHCVDGLKAFSCQCAAGYSGVRCEVDIDECASNPCSALGTEKCYSLPNNDYSCKCKMGFLGKNCHIDINECLSNPCQNGAECKDGAGKHICLCQMGYSGLNCERRVYSCSDDPCLNSGTCLTHTNGSFSCACVDGVKGKSCEWNLDDCLAAPCQNGGTCVDLFGNYECKCPVGYTGRNCEQEINECQSNPCKHNGTCEDMMGHYRCKCPVGFNGTDCEEEAKCPYSYCKKTFVPGGTCNESCNTHSCNWDGTLCSLGIQPWKNCSVLTASGEFCFKVFQNGICDKHCNKAECLFDGFDCNAPKEECSNDDYCKSRFENAICDTVCDSEACLKDGLDCETGKPEPGEGTLILVLRVPPEVFRNGSRIFMRELSAVLNTIAFIKRLGNEEMIYSFDLRTRKRRQVVHLRVVRAADGTGTKVHVQLDQRGCSGPACISTASEAARYLGALKSSNKLDLPYPVYRVEVEDSSSTSSPPVSGTKLSPLYIAILCVVIPLLLVGGLLGGKKVYAKLWVPEGFPIYRSRRQPSTRRDPVGQEVSMRSMSKSSSEIDEEGACADGESSRSDLTPPRESKRVKLDNGEDSRKWTSLHKQAADVTVRNCALALTPPQEGSGERGAPGVDVDARGPGGMTALHLASCRGTYGDGSSLDDDKDSDDSGGAMVSDLLSLGANFVSKTDLEETPLHLAARHSRADVAKRLLDYGADANARDRLNRTPLHLAIGADAQGVFQILLRNRATDLEARMDDGTTPLILAARHDLPDLVRHLIKAGVKVNSADNQGKTALHWAASVNSLDVTKELLRNGAKKDAQDEKGQTPLFLGCREGSVQTVRHLLVNYANRKVADSMDMTPEDIAKQRHHHDIVGLLTDWSLGCNSPKAVPAPTSPPEGQKSPMVSIASPLATSPPAVEIPNGSAAAMVQQFHAARPKATGSRTPGSRPRPSATGNNNNNNAKRKRKKARPDEEVHSSMSVVPTLSSPGSGHVVTSCTAGQQQQQAFSPNCVPITNGLSPLGSISPGISPGISPADSTTLSPFQAPNSLDAQPPSPLEILSPDDLAGLEEVDLDWSLVDALDDPTDMSICGFTMNTSLGQGTAMDHTVPTTSDCLYMPVRPIEGQRLYSVHSTPDLPCVGLQPSDSRSLVFNGRTCHSAQKAPPPISQQAAFQAITNSNMYSHAGGVGGLGNGLSFRKDYQNDDYSMRHQQLQHMPHQLVFPADEMAPVHTQVRFMNNYDSSPQKYLSSFPTPSPDSPGDCSSSSSSSSC